MSESPAPNSSGPAGGVPVPQPGMLVGAGRFQLVQELGKGGMGVVWLAQDRNLSERVALKFLTSGIHSDPMALEDLRRETRRSHQLSHPNIVRIHDLYEPRGETPFISMEYVEGPTLNILRLQQPRRLLGWEFLRPYVQQLCLALDYAHGEDVIHRDLKPANLMLDRRQRLKLADFGIAATVSDAHSRRAVEQPTSGTITFMSPQQMEGRPPAVTDDIYSLGATLYELLTSRPPFYIGNVPWQVKHTPATPLDERLVELGLSNEIPPDVQSLVMACLAKRPEERPRSAKAIAGWVGIDLGAAPGVEELGAEVVAKEEPRPARVVWQEPEGEESVTPVSAKPQVQHPIAVPVPAAEPGKFARSLAGAVLALSVGVLGWVAWGIFGRDKVVPAMSPLLPPVVYPSNEDAKPKEAVGPTSLPAEEPAPQRHVALGPVPPRYTHPTNAPAWLAFRALAPLPANPRPHPAPRGMAVSSSLVCELAVPAQEETAGSQAGASLQGGSEFMVAHYSARRESLTTKFFSSPGDDGGSAAALDARGGLYTAGWFSERLDCDQLLLKSAGGTDILVGRLGLEPGQKWFARGGGAQDDAALAVAVDAAGNCFVSGFFRGNATFDTGAGTASRALTSVGGQDIFVAKYRPDGELGWLQATGKTNDDCAYAIALDRTGSLFVAGQTTLLLGSPPAGGPPVFRGFGAEDVLLFRLDAEGKEVWDKPVIGGSAKADLATAVAVDREGNCIVAGYLGAEANLGGVVLTNAGGKDIFIAKFDPGGRLLWARREGGPGDDVALALALDARDNIYVGGYTTGDTQFAGGEVPAVGGLDSFVAKYSSDGNAVKLNWLLGGVSREDDWVAGLAISSEDECHALGCFSGPVYVGGGTAVTSDKPCHFVARIGSVPQPRLAPALASDRPPRRGQPTRFVPITNGLVLCFSFDSLGDDGSLLDESGHGNDARSYGLALVPGRVGKAVHFAERESFVTVAEAGSLRLTSLSIAAWIKTGRNVQSARRLLDKHAEDGFALSLLGGKNPEQPGCLMLEVGLPGQSCTNETRVDDDAWHFVVATAEGMSQRLYVDADMMGFASAARNAEVPVSHHDLLLGINDGERLRYATGTSEGFLEGVSFDGLLDELMIFNRVLSREEIEKLYQSSKP